MAFFKFRQGSDKPSLAPAQPESLELMRKRARYRFTGAVVLVLAGVVGFPWVFDTQPRPIAVDIPITIPDKQHAPPLLEQPVAAPIPAPSTPPAPAPATALTPAAAPAPHGASVVPAGASLGAKEQVVSEAPASGKASSPSPAQAQTPVPAPPHAEAEAQRAKTLLEGGEATGDKSAAKAPAEQRYVIQVGAYTEAAKLHEVRAKLEKAGFKTYTQDIEAKEGKRTRVRVGPFGNKAEADKVAHKIKGLNLPANVLTL